MALIKINHHPSRRQLNLFGAMWLVFFGVAAAMAWSHGRADWLVWALATAAVAVPLVGWTVPRVMRWVYLGMTYAALPVGSVLSHVLLAAVYYLVLTPIGLALRACGRDPLARRLDRGAKSYWIARPGGESVDVERYFRQV